MKELTASNNYRVVVTSVASFHHSLSKGCIRKIKEDGGKKNPNPKINNKDVENCIKFTWTKCQINQWKVSSGSTLTFTAAELTIKQH